MNRNFGFHWNEGGSSSNGCSDTFHGGAAFSEVESQHVRDAILAVAGPAEMYLTFHAYGQYWLTPWGYTATYPSDYTQLVRIWYILNNIENFLKLTIIFIFQYNLAVSAVNKLTAVYGTQYTIGSSTNVLCKEHSFYNYPLLQVLIHKIITFLFIILDVASGGSDDWAKVV